MFVGEKLQLHRFSAVQPEAEENSIWLCNRLARVGKTEIFIPHSRKNKSGHDSSRRHFELRKNRRRFSWLQQLGEEEGWEWQLGKGATAKFLLLPGRNNNLMKTEKVAFPVVRARQEENEQKPAGEQKKVGTTTAIWRRTANSQQTTIKRTTTDFLAFYQMLNNCDRQLEVKDFYDCSSSEKLTSTRRRVYNSNIRRTTEEERRRLRRCFVLWYNLTISN